MDFFFLNEDKEKKNQNKKKKNVQTVILKINYFFLVTHDVCTEVKVTNWVVLVIWT